MPAKLLIFDLDDTLFPRLPDDYTQKDLQTIQLYPQAREILEDNQYAKVLVTKGDPEFQNQKINILGIRNFFDSILICSTDLKKKICFQQALAQFPSLEAWIIGDRKDTEIRYGNELGLKTVLFKRGKYSLIMPKDQLERAQYEITTYWELQRILKGSFSSF